MTSAIDWNVASTAATPVSPSRELASVLEIVVVDNDVDNDDDGVDADAGDEGVTIIVAAVVVVDGAAMKVKDEESLPGDDVALLLLLISSPPPVELQDVTPAKQIRPSGQPYPRGQDWMQDVDASS